jgi:hypothetical protein
MNLLIARLAMVIGYLAGSIPFAHVGAPYLPGGSQTAVGPTTGSLPTIPRWRERICLRGEGSLENLQHAVV